MASPHDLINYKGYKVKLVTPEGEYEGVVRGYNATMEQVVLEKVLMMPKREPLGCLNFFMFEVKSFKILQEPKAILQKEDSPSEPEGVVSNIIDDQTEAFAFYCRGVVSNIVDDKTEAVDVPSLAQSENASSVSSDDQTIIQDLYECFSDAGSDSQVNSFEEEEEEEKDFVLRLPLSLRTKLPVDWILFNEFHEDFFKAIHYISMQNVVGVSFEGQSIGRNGQLSLIGVSTRACTFLFDIIALKDEAFEKGLKPIFENSKVEKVIHDCRQPSDALFHIYKTSLVNVFDTQVADVFVTLGKRKCEKGKSHVDFLPECIHSYLNLREEDIYPEEIDFQALKTDIDWMRRPVTNAMKEVATKNVIFLRELRSVLLDHMMSAYKRTVDIYLGVLRDARAEELDLFFPHLLPKAVKLNGVHVIHYGEISEDSETPAAVSACNDNDNKFRCFALNNGSKEQVSDDEAPDK